ARPCGDLGVVPLVGRDPPGDALRTEALELTHVPQQVVGELLLRYQGLLTIFPWRVKQMFVGMRSEVVALVECALQCGAVFFASQKFPGEEKRPGHLVLIECVENMLKALAEPPAGKDQRQALLIARSPDDCSVCPFEIAVHSPFVL